MELGVVPESVYERGGPASVGDVDAALLRFWILVVALAAVCWIARWGRRLAAGVIALLGVIIWAGAVLSPWPELRINELMLVFVPLDVFLLHRSSAGLYASVRLAILALVALLAVAGVLVQPLWPYWLLAAATVGSFWWHGRMDILAP